MGKGYGEGDYDFDARDDAADMAEHFADDIAEQYEEDGEASDDTGNDYHHETYTDNVHNFDDAADVLKQLDEHEETDSGLWEGQDFKRAAITCACLTYGNAVAHYWRQIIEAVNEDDELEAIREEFDAIDEAEDEHLKSDAEDGPDFDAQRDAVRAKLKARIAAIIADHRPSKD